MRKKKKEKEEKETRERASTFSHSFDFLRLTCITRERAASSHLVITLSLFLLLLFFSSGALLYELTKSRFPLLFLLFCFFRYNKAQHYDNFSSSFSRCLRRIHQSIETISSILFFFRIIIILMMMIRLESYI